MIWLAVSAAALVALHFTPRDSVRETMAATLALACIGVAVVELVMAA